MVGAPMKDDAKRGGWVWGGWFGGLFFFVGVVFLFSNNNLL